MNFAIEVICLTDGEGKPVPPTARPVLVEHAAFRTLDDAVRQVVTRGEWEMIGEPMKVAGHSAVVTVRRERNLCSIHIIQENEQ